jgi:hypothetical protein
MRGDVGGERFITGIARVFFGERGTFNTRHEEAKAQEGVLEGSAAPALSERGRGSTRAGWRGKGFRLMLEGAAAAEEGEEACAEEGEGSGFGCGAGGAGGVVNGGDLGGGEVGVVEGDFVDVAVEGAVAEDVAVADGEGVAAVAVVAGGVGGDEGAVDVEVAVIVGGEGGGDEDPCVERGGGEGGVNIASGIGVEVEVVVVLDLEVEVVAAGGLPSDVEVAIGNGGELGEVVDCGVLPTGAGVDL